MRQQTLLGQQILACPYARQCGGCSRLDVPYSEQLARKQALVDRLLRPLGPVEPIRGMENPYHYRNKVHTVFAADRQGKLISGVYREGTHHVVPVERCLIEDERADGVLSALLSVARAFHYAPYDEDRRTGFLRHALVRVGHQELMLVLVTATAAFPGKKAFLKALLQARPDITTVVQNLNDRPTSQVLGDRDTVLFGKGYIEDTLCGMTFRISPQSFYQVNTLQTEVLYSLVGEMANLTGRETVLDAYCGVGTIGLTLANRCARLLGVELNPEAVRDAQLNARRNNVGNARFVCDDAGRRMGLLAQERCPVDLVVMDPPRSGSSEAFLRSLLQLAPGRVVYVSCDPTTLARDVEVLDSGGYRLRRAVPVDMFPATEHVECVTLLERDRR